MLRLGEYWDSFCKRMTKTSLLLLLLELLTRQIHMTWTVYFHLGFQAPMNLIKMRRYNVWLLGLGITQTFVHYQFSVKMGIWTWTSVRLLLIRLVSSNLPTLMYLQHLAFYSLSAETSTRPLSFLKELSKRTPLTTLSGTNMVLPSPTPWELAKLSMPTSKLLIFAPTTLEPWSTSASRITTPSST
mgnify:CR=1 FL=1